MKSAPNHPYRWDRHLLTVLGCDDPSRSPADPGDTCDAKYPSDEDSLHVPETP